MPNYNEYTTQEAVNRLAKGSGGVYNSSPPTYATGDTVTAQYDINGNQKVSLATTIAGEDIVNDVLKVEQRFTNTRVTADTLIKSGVGFLHNIIVSQPASATPTAGVLTVYDSTIEANTVIFQQYFPASAIPTPVTITLNTAFNVGCYVGFDATLAGLAFNIGSR